MKPEIMYIAIICFIFLFGCTAKLLNNAEIGNDEQVVRIDFSDFTEILKPIKETPCGSILIYPDTIIYNITGKVYGEIKNNTILYMTSIRDLTLNNSLFATEHCYPFWKVRMKSKNKLHARLSWSVVSDLLQEQKKYWRREWPTLLGWPGR